MRWQPNRTMTVSASASGGRARGGDGRLARYFQRIVGAVSAIPTSVCPPLHPYKCAQTIVTRQTHPVTRDRDAASVRLRLLFIVMTAGLILSCDWQNPSAAVGSVPEHKLHFVEAQYGALNYSVTKYESLIKVPTEQSFSKGALWLNNIHFESSPSLSSTVLLFVLGTGNTRARQMVLERPREVHIVPHMLGSLTSIQPLPTLPHRLAKLIGSAIDDDDDEDLLVAGAILAMVLMAVILFDRVADLMNLLGIPLAFLAALGVLHLRGSPVISKVFAGLISVLGAVFDGANLFLRSSIFVLKPLTAEVLACVFWPLIARNVVRP